MVLKSWLDLWKTSKTKTSGTATSIPDVRLKYYQLIMLGII